MTHTLKITLALTLLSLAGCSQELAPQDTLDELPPDALADDRQLKEGGDFGPAPVQIEPARPHSQTQIVLVVEDPGGIDARMEVRGRGCGELTSLNGDLVQLPLFYDAVVGDGGSCSVSATIHYEDGTEFTHNGSIRVQEREPQLLPMEVPGSVFMPDLPPNTTPLGPAVTGITAPSSFINGQGQSWVLEHNSGIGIRAAVIWLDGYPGYYRLPLGHVEGPVELPLYFPSDAFSKLNEERADELPVMVALEDSAGYLGPAALEPVSGEPVGSGDVKVSISWNGAADVDLHVREPSGETIFYGNTGSATGGQLDLDSNPTCDIDGTNAENVFWPSGDAPRGSYRARVHVYDGCDAGPVSGTLTIETCASEPRTESFTLGAGEEFVVDFDDSCDGIQVSGRVRYEDFTVSSSGMSSTGQMLPARYIQVRALTWDDDDEIATTYTDRTGRYSMTLPEEELDDERSYWIQVRAEVDFEGIRQKATRGGSHVYKWNIDREINVDEEPTAEVNLDVEKNNSGGALNMMDVGVDCILFLKSFGLSISPVVKWNWKKGSRSGSWASSSTINAAGASSDPDEYDDVVMGHEFGHVAMFQLSDSDSPGGSHSPWSRVTPTLAWGEGFATYFGAAALGLDRYIDTRGPGGGIRINHSIESLPSSIPLGTTGGLSGRISEAVVAASLLDLHDEGNESKDTLSGLSSSIWTVMTGYLGDDSDDYGSGRGRSGRDYIDFLDGWLCHRQGHLGDDNTEGLRGNVRGLHNVPYDFPDYECD